MKWGLFGGTFDPVHFGHLRAALELACQLALERVIFIPAGEPPHKTACDITPFDHRLRMVRLAIAGNDRFDVSDLESRRRGKSYSVDTVRSFLAEHSSPPDLYFITGQDAFDAITTWRQWEELLGLCHFAVMTRPGYENGGLNRILPAELAARYVYDAKQDGFISPAGRGIFFRRTTFLDISASAIRESIRAGRSIAYLTPDAVMAYIASKRLYGSSGKV